MEYDSSALALREHNAPGKLLTPHNQVQAYVGKFTFSIGQQKADTKWNRGLLKDKFKKY